MRWIGYVGTALAFFLVGAGAHTTQTAGLALATDIAPEHARPRVVALMYLMLLVGTVVSALVLGRLLRTTRPIRLIQVIQGAAVLTMVLNTFCLWKQEARQRGVTPYAEARAAPALPRRVAAPLPAAAARCACSPRSGLGFFAFNLQDVLLEPYGGEILHQTVGQTTALTGIMAMGAILAFWVAARALERGRDAVRLAAYGALLGVVALRLRHLRGPARLGAALPRRHLPHRHGRGTLRRRDALARRWRLKDHQEHGMALGAWGAVFATAEGLALAVSGVIEGRRGAPRGEGCARRRLQHAVRAVQCRVPPRDRGALRHAHCPRTPRGACSHDAAAGR